MKTEDTALLRRQTAIIYYDTNTYNY